MRTVAFAVPIRRNDIRIAEISSNYPNKSMKLKRRAEGDTVQKSTFDPSVRRKLDTSGRSAEKRAYQCVAANYSG